MNKHLLNAAVLLFCAASTGAVAQTLDTIENFGRAQADAMRDWAVQHIDGARDIQDFYDNAETLSANECTPNFDTKENARMSSTCRGRAECQMCYRDAVKKMDFYRKQLGRMSCIYKNTTSFSGSAISFGDSYSGFHGMSGAAWQVQKGSIRQSLTKLKVTYDSKYSEFIKGLGTSLREFDACETQFGGADWYQKNGFIYFEFMQEKYKRND